MTGLLIKQGVKATSDNARDLWQTPRYILDLVDQFFHNDWFDPCPVAPTYNGLELSWGRSAYINPPFSEYRQWADHGIDIYRLYLRRIAKCEYIFLSHTNHDVAWYKNLLKEASAIILLDKRVRFIDSRTGLQSKNTAIGKCQTLFYLGHRPKKFIKTFSGLGFGIVLK